MITRRPDLPPITRRLNAQLRELDLNALDPESAAAISELSSVVLNVTAELENDLIISRGRTDRPTLTRPAS
ncbi:hypothetical protein [Gordonia caeni]|uniref:Histidine kinase n=1 Tax=Gordonia caeni TaxID=1007097 RepID=A0ABP7PIW9_9ACTN